MELRGPSGRLCGEQHLDEELQQLAGAPWLGRIRLVVNGVLTSTVGNIEVSVGPSYLTVVGFEVGRRQ